MATILFPQKLLDDPPTTFLRDSIAEPVRDSVRITDLNQLLDKLFQHQEQLFTQKVNQLLDIDSCPTSIIGRFCCLTIDLTTELQNTIFFYLSRQRVEIQYAYYSYKIEYNNVHLCELTPHRAAKRPLRGAEGPTILFLKIER